MWCGPEKKGEGALKWLGRETLALEQPDLLTASGTAVCYESVALK